MNDAVSRVSIESRRTYDLAPMNAPNEPAKSEPTVREYFQKLGPAGILAVAAATLPPLGSIVLFSYISSISAWFRSHQESGPFLFAMLFVPLGGLALLPTYATAALAGWAFGLPIGLAAVISGILGAATLAYVIARFASRDRVVRVLEERPDSRAIYQALLRGSYLRTLGIVTLLRFPPNSPFALTNLVLSSAKVRLDIYLMGTLVGMLPRTALAVWIASTIQGDFANDRPSWVIYVSIAAAVVVIVVIGKIAQNALKRAVA
jgi:uncharacterized membrane protein YdjX (TVP38/TMEM64 family)